MRSIITTLIGCFVILAGCSTPGQKAETATCESLKDDMEVVMSLERKVKPEHVADYKASFDKCKVESLKEEGCLYYDMFQSYSDSTEFMIVEAWKNKAAHLNHMTLEHFKVHMEEIRDLGEPGFKGYGSEVYVCPNVN